MITTMQENLQAEATKKVPRLLPHPATERIWREMGQGHPVFDMSQVLSM